MANLILHPDASEEYQEAYDWYFVRDPQAAADFESEVERGLQEIADNPERWPLLDKTRRHFILTTYPFYLVYRVSADSILIVAVAHASRRPRYWRHRDK